MWSNGTEFRLESLRSSTLTTCIQAFAQQFPWTPASRAHQPVGYDSENAQPVATQEEGHSTLQASNEQENASLEGDTRLRRSESPPFDPNRGILAGRKRDTRDLSYETHPDGSSRSQAKPKETESHGNNESDMNSLFDECDENAGMKDDEGEWSSLGGLLD